MTIKTIGLIHPNSVRHKQSQRFRGKRVRVLSEEEFSPRPGWKWARLANVPGEEELSSLRTFSICGIRFLEDS